MKTLYTGEIQILKDDIAALRNPNNKFIAPRPIAGLIANKARMILLSAGLPLLKAQFYDSIPQRDDDPDGYSAFGTPVFDNLIMEAPDYYEVPDDGQIDAQTPKKQLSGNYSLPGPSNPFPGREFNAFRIDPVLMEVNMRKMVVRTPMSGSRGSVKEIVCLDDYDIKISGFIDSGRINQYPKALVVAFREYMEAPIAIRVHSQFLNNFGITNIVVQECVYKQKEGMRNLQFFEITACSDEDISINLNPTTTTTVL